MDEITSNYIVPEAWTMHIHPRGHVYFQNPSLNIVTSDDIRQPSTLRVFDEWATKELGQYELEDGMELVVQIMPSSLDTPGSCSVHLAVDHVNCVASYELDEISREHVSKAPPHVLNRKRRLYWNNLWSTPCHIPTPTIAMKEASETLAWFYTDFLTSGKESNVPLTENECDRVAGLLHRNSSSDNGEISPSRNCALAWLLKETCRFRASQRWGQYTIREHRHFSVIRAAAHAAQPHAPPSTLVFLLKWIMRLFFFDIPVIYLDHLKRATKYQGPLSNIQQTWEEHVQRLVREYSHFILISTVLLSATVSLLGAQDLGFIGRTAVHVSAYSALGSTVVGVFSIWRYQTNQQISSSFIYMHNAQTSLLGLHGHAMVLSLPSVLLVWSLLAFAIALLAYSVQFFSEARIAVLIMVVVFALIFLLVIGGLHTFASVWRFNSAPSTFSLFGLLNRRPKAERLEEMYL